MQIKLYLTRKKTETVIFKFKQKKIEGDLKITWGIRLYPTETVKYPAVESHVSQNVYAVIAGKVIYVFHCVTIGYTMQRRINGSTRVLSNADAYQANQLLLTVNCFCKKAPS